MKYPESFYKSLTTELNSIVNYWKHNSVDKKEGGFLGKRDHYNHTVPNAHKGIILNTRLLWSFSMLQQYDPHFNVHELAKRSFLYLKTYFEDKYDYRLL